MLGNSCEDSQERLNETEEGTNEGRLTRSDIESVVYRGLKLDTFSSFFFHSVLFGFRFSEQVFGARRFKLEQSVYNFTYVMHIGILNTPLLEIQSNSILVDGRWTVATRRLFIHKNAEIRAYPIIADKTSCLRI